VVLRYASLAIFFLVFFVGQSIISGVGIKEDVPFIGGLKKTP
jgi:hypothetical protein